MTLYQKSPTRNVQLGMAISLLTLSILFYFEKFALGNSFFQFCEANQFLSSIDAFRNLIFFPYRFKKSPISDTFSSAEVLLLLL